MMNKDYISPELEVVRYTLRDVLSGSPTDSIPIQDGGGDLPDPSEPELPDL